MSLGPGTHTHMHTQTHIQTQHTHNTQMHINMDEAMKKTKCTMILAFQLPFYNTYIDCVI